MNASPVRRWAFVVAAGSALVLAWHGAIDTALIVPAPPDFVPHQAIDDAFAAQFAWLRGIAGHDLGVRVLAAATFLSLAGLGRALTGSVHQARRGVVNTGSSLAPAGRLLVVAGLVGAIGQLVEIGGRDAAMAASATTAPATAVMMNMFFFDQVGAAMAAATWAIFGIAALLGANATRGWRSLPGVALGTALLTIAASWWIDDPADVSASLLRLSGLVLIPAWALSLDRAPRGNRRLVVGVAGALLAFALAGCSGTAPTTTTAATSSRPSAPTSIAVPSPSLRIAPVPDRITFHQRGQRIDAPRSDLVGASASVVDTGIQAFGTDGRRPRRWRLRLPGLGSAHERGGRHLARPPRVVKLPGHQHRGAEDAAGSRIDRQGRAAIVGERDDDAHARTGAARLARAAVTGASRPACWARSRASRSVEQGDPISGTVVGCADNRTRTLEAASGRAAAPAESGKSPLTCPLPSPRESRCRVARY